MHQPLSSRELKHTLDHVIQTARDTQLGYQAAAANVENTELETLFRDYAQQRQAFMFQLQELQPILLDEDPVTDPTLGGQLQARWIGFREAMNWESEKVVLAEIGKMEQHAISVLEGVLHKNTLPSEVTECLERELALYREGAARAKVIYDDPDKSDRGIIPGTYTDGRGSTSAGRSPVPRA